MPRSFQEILQKVQHGRGDDAARFLGEWSGELQDVDDLVVTLRDELQLEEPYPLTELYRWCQRLIDQRDGPDDPPVTGRLVIEARWETGAQQPEPDGAE